MSNRLAQGGARGELVRSRDFELQLDRSWFVDRCTYLNEIAEAGIASLST
jgi:hypothetical protein